MIRTDRHFRRRQPPSQQHMQTQSKHANHMHSTKPITPSGPLTSFDLLAPTQMLHTNWSTRSNRSTRTERSQPIDANRAVTTPPTSIDLTPIAPPEPNNFIPRPFNLLSNPTAPSKRPSVDLAALQRQIRSNMQAHEEFRRRIGLPSEPPTSSPTNTCR